MLNRIRLWLRTVFLRQRLEREMQAEMSAHLEQATERLVARGLSPDEARRAARREFGNVDYIQEQSREAHGARWIETLVADIRYGARTLRRAPVFTLVAVLSIGLAIGANTAVFGVVHTMLLDRLPVTRPGELVVLRHGRGGEVAPMFGREQYQALAAESRIPLSAFQGIPVSEVAIDGAPVTPIERNIGVDMVDGSFFGLIGLEAAAGRLLEARDDADASTAVISFRLAQRSFGSAPAAVGRTLAIEGHPFTIVGVTPRSYRGLRLGGSWEVALPAGAMRLLEATFARYAPRGRRYSELPFLSVIGRVKEDRAVAQSAIDQAYQQCCSGARGGVAESGARAARLILADMSRGIADEKIDLRVQYGRPLLLLMGGVATLLLIACMNVGNLQLARAFARSRELAVRLSLGASRARVARQLLVESSLLAVSGAALGGLFAWRGTALLTGHLPNQLRLLQPFVSLRPNGTVLAFTMAVTVLCALLFGVLPAVRATRRDLIAGVRDGRGVSARFGMGSAMIALQIGLALVLTSAAGLLVATLVNLGSETPVDDPSTLVIADVRVRGTRFADEPQRPLLDNIHERIRALPGVRASAATSIAPLIFLGGYARALDVAGYETASDDEMMSGGVHVGPGYFDVTGIALKSGRDFGPQDQLGSERAVIVSENIAQQFFAGRDPIGETIRFRGDTDPMRVIGVAEDAKYYDLRSPAPRTVYLAGAQETEEALIPSIFVLRTDGSPNPVAEVRSAITALVPGADVRVQLMAAAAAFQVGREQSLAWLAAIFSALAIGLAAMGIYGVMAFRVSARTSEIGIRIALGADRHRVLRMVIRQSLALVALGVVVGVPLTLAAASAMSAQLYEVTAWDPGPLAVAAVILGMVGVLASLLPARRAARVDPLIAMRSD